MSGLVRIFDSVVVTTSSELAVVFEVSHFAMLQRMSELHCSRTFFDRNFFYHKNSTGCLVTKDGFIFISAVYPGMAGVKERYIEDFNTSEKLLAPILNDPVRGFWRSLLQSDDTLPASNWMQETIYLNALHRKHLKALFAAHLLSIGDLYVKPTYRNMMVIGQVLDVKMVSRKGERLLRLPPLPHMRQYFGRWKI